MRQYPIFRGVPPAGSLAFNRLAPPLGRAPVLQRAACARKSCWCSVGREGCGGFLRPRGRYARGVFAGLHSAWRKPRGLRCGACDLRRVCQSSSARMRVPLDPVCSFFETRFRFGRYGGSRNHVSALSSLRRWCTGPGKSIKIHFRLRFGLHELAARCRPIFRYFAGRANSSNLLEKGPSRSISKSGGPVRSFRLIGRPPAVHKNPASSFCKSGPQERGRSGAGRQFP